MTDAFDQFKAMQKQGWALFAPLESVTILPAARLVKFAGVAKDRRVLDVACGTGTTAVTAARLGANVTGLDLTPELIERARFNSSTAGLNIDLHEGDVEKLPFADASFDVVLSQFGHIFAPRPALALGEMLRVLKPSGTIAFSTWPPDLMVGRMFALISRYLPPPPVAVAPPPQWGDRAIVTERLGSAVRDIQFETAVMIVPALSLHHYRNFTEKTAGPLTTLVKMLEKSDPARLTAFRAEFDALTAPYFRDNALHQDFLMTRAVRN